MRKVETLTPSERKTLNLLRKIHDLYNQDPDKNPKPTDEQRVKAQALAAKDMDSKISTFDFKL